MNGDTRISRAERVAFRELTRDAGGVVLRLDTGQYHGVNDVGRLIWELIGDGITFDGLVSGVEAAVTEPASQLKADIEKFVEDMAARSLLVINR